LAVSSLVIIWFAHNGRFVAQVLVLFVLIVPRHHRRSDLRGGIALQIIAAGPHSTKQVEAGAW
jgi:hypothetical protein